MTHPSPSPFRRSERRRITKETTIEVAIDIDGGDVEVSTGVPFFDHMLAQLGKHGGFGLSVHAEGDLLIDTHHTVEDTGILLGECVREALADKTGVRRFASIAVPLDEALIDVAVDLSGRPFLVYEINPYAGGSTSKLGEPGFDPQLAEEFWRGFVMASAMTLHMRMISGKNSHHIIEASFKATARALREAMQIVNNDMPSTKGTLDA